VVRGAGKESDPEPPASSEPVWAKCGTFLAIGNFKGCGFTTRDEDHSDLTGNILAIQCTFVGITTKKLGGATRLKGKFTGIDCTWIGCQSTRGGGIIIQGATGIGQLEGCRFETCSHGSGSFSAENCGGALSVRGGGTCRCQTSNFTSNNDGAISIEGSCELLDCRLTSNSGTFGGLFIVNGQSGYDISLNSCRFVENRGTGRNGQSIHFESGSSSGSSLTLSVTDCHFQSEQDSAIYFTSTSIRVSFGSNCFRGNVRQIASKTSLDIEVSGRLCFANELNDAIDNIEFVQSSLGQIVYTCDTCWISSSTSNPITSESLSSSQSESPSESRAEQTSTSLVAQPTQSSVDLAIVSETEPILRATVAATVRPTATHSSILRPATSSESATRHPDASQLASPRASTALVPITASAPDTSKVPRSTPESPRLETTGSVSPLPSSISHDSQAPSPAGIGTRSTATGDHLPSTNFPDSPGPVSRSASRDTVVSAPIQTPAPTGLSPIDPSQSLDASDSALPDRERDGQESEAEGLSVGAISGVVIAIAIALGAAISTYLRYGILRLRSAPTPTLGARHRLNQESSPGIRFQATPMGLTQASKLPSQQPFLFEFLTARAPLFGYLLWLSDELSLMLQADDKNGEWHAAFACSSGDRPSGLKLS
jgi:hypothetical protein